MLPPLSHAELFLPTDWLDLVLDTDDGSADAHFRDLARQVFPGAPDEVVEEVGQDLQRWRRLLAELGVVSHGVVAVPDEGPQGAYWQIMTAVVELPAQPEIDLGEVLARLFADEHAQALHSEAFTTELGAGFGLLATPTVGPSETLVVIGLATAAAPRAVGLAVALTARPGDGAGLLVVGMCLDASQAVSLASLVAAVAGRSRLTVAPPTD